MPLSQIFQMPLKWRKLELKILWTDNLWNRWTKLEKALQIKSCAMVSNRITISILTTKRYSLSSGNDDNYKINIFTIWPWLATLFLQKSISAENCNKIGYAISPPTLKLFPKPALRRLSQLPKVCCLNPVPRLETELQTPQGSNRAFTRELRSPGTS